MKDVIIVCAGNRAKTIHEYINWANKAADENKQERPYNLLGFINDIPDALEGSGIVEPILGTIKDWEPRENEWYIMGTSDPKNKEKLAVMLKDRGCRFMSFVAPNVFIPSDLVMGEGCVVEAYRIGCCVKLGDFVSINSSMIMSGATIDSYSTTTGFTVVEKAYVGKRVFIGSHAVISEGVHIADDARIGIGSIVTEDVEKEAVVFGIPAKKAGW